MTAHVLLYSTAVCPYCVRAERLLEALLDSGDKVSFLRRWLLDKRH